MQQRLEQLRDFQKKNSLKQLNAETDIQPSQERTKKVFNPVVTVSP
jgi:hypothetical protein